MKKKQFKVTLNWQGEIHTFYSYAVSELQAFYGMTTKLANELKINSYVVRNYFMKNGNRYNIKEI